MYFICPQYFTFKYHLNATFVLKYDIPNQITLYDWCSKHFHDFSSYTVKFISTQNALVEYFQHIFFSYIIILGLI